MTMTQTMTVRVMTLGIGSDVLSTIATPLKGCSFSEGPLELEKLMEPQDPPPGIVLCAQAPAGISLAETAQMLRSTYVGAAIFYVALPGEKQDRKTLVKNGFNDVFFLPIDQSNLVRTMREKAAELGSADRVFKRVSLMDVVPNTVLDFDTYLYLPANGKYVRYSAAGDPLDAERVKKLKNHQVGSLYVPAESMKEFYKYAAKSLRDTASDASLSETERTEKLENAVRELIVGLFSDQATSTEEGKRAMQDMQSIVRTYVTAGAMQEGMYTRIQTMNAQDRNAYSHAANVSTFASLFAIALACPNQEVEEIAMAALLHDLGLMSLPAEVLATPPSDWIQADREIYESHPEKTVGIIKDRRLVVPEAIHKIILQHHERYNGTGFPNKLVGDRTCRGAQLLAIADEFDERLAPTPGRPDPKPRDVIHQMFAENGTGPTTAKFNPELLRKIHLLFTPVPERSEPESG
jgi:HD-GYP domain-containing protein (c-di-GMP phosphodiesterase class II)